MDLYKELAAKQSKERVLRILNYIGTDKKRVKELMDHFLNGESRICQHSSWVVGHLGEQQPKLLKPYLKSFIEKLKSGGHNAIRRNIVRILAHIEIDDKYLGEFAELCFSYINDTKEAIAVRCFSITVLYKICLREPLLSHELKMVLEEHLPQGSAGFRSRAKKTLKLLDEILESQ